MRPLIIARVVRLSNCQAKVFLGEKTVFSDRVEHARRTGGDAGDGGVGVGRRSIVDEFVLIH